MSYITKVIAREILDSRGNPTLEVRVETKSGAVGVASVPSGASTGKNEALELRDGDQKRYGGKGVLKAISNVNKKIASLVVGKSVLNQKEIDQLLIKKDGTENKSKLGANAILGVSLAVCRAGANFKNMPLYLYLSEGQKTTIPMPFFNVINGGSHADSSVDFQEYMIVPVGAKTFKSALEMASNVFRVLKQILKSKKLSTGVGDEGGFAPNFSSNEMPLKFICEAIKKAGYQLNCDFAIALDVAASEFYDEKKKKYVLKKSGEGEKTTSEMISYLNKLVKKYPIISLEDPLAETDKEGFTQITKKLASQVQIVGDDLFVTNPKFLQEGIENKQANAVLIKPNQIGTLTETMQVISLAQTNGFKTMISHRSGETTDTFIADLAVATASGQIKSGSVCRGERICKYNRILEIEECLGKKSVFAQKS